MNLPSRLPIVSHLALVFAAQVFLLLVVGAVALQGKHRPGNAQAWPTPSQARA